MKHILLSCLIAALLCVSFSVAQHLRMNSVLIKNITVIDCTGHAPQPGMSVLISGDHVDAVLPAAQVKAPSNAEIVEGQGKYLIPGLWNMHVHLGAYADGKAALSAFLAEGITVVRDMGSPLDDILRLRKTQMTARS